MPVLPEGTTFRPSLRARALNKDARVRLVVTDALLAHEDSDGDGHVIPWPEVEAAVPAREGNGRVSGALSRPDRAPARGNRARSGGGRG